MFLFAKPEVELIHTIAAIEYIENGENRMYSNEMRQKTNNGLSIGTMTSNFGWPWTVLVQGHWNYTSKYFENGDR